MTGLDFILIVWASVIASSIFAVPYEENWGMKRFRILFCITACLVITSFIFLTASVLIQDILAYHLSSSYVIPAIFVSGFILAFFTRDYWSFEKLQSIKSLTVYAIFGETLVLSLGDSISGTQNADPWVRGLFLIAVLIIIALSGIAIIKLTIDERKPW
jgi:hypothetical protein